MAERDGSGRPQGHDVSSEEAERLSEGFRPVWDRSQGGSSGGAGKPRGGGTQPMASLKPAGAPPRPDSAPPRPDSAATGGTSAPPSGGGGVGGFQQATAAPGPAADGAPRRARSGTLLGMKPVPKQVPARTGGTPPMGTAAVRPQAAAPAGAEGEELPAKKSDYAPPAPPPASKRAPGTSDSLPSVELQGGPSDPNAGAPPGDASETTQGPDPRAATTPREGVPAVRPAPAEPAIARERVDTAPPRRKLAPAPTVAPPHRGRQTVGMAIGALVLLIIGFALRSVLDPLLNRTAPPEPASAVPLAAPAPPPRAEPEGEPVVVPDIEAELPMDEEPLEDEQPAEPVAEEPAAEEKPQAPIEADSVPRVTPKLTKPRSPPPAPKPVATSAPRPTEPKVPPPAAPKVAPAPAPTPRPTNGRGAIVRDTPF